MKNIDISNIPKKFKDYLKTGESQNYKYYNKDGYLNRSKLEYSILYSLIAQNYSKYYILQVFEEANEKLYYFVNPEWFEDAYIKAKAYYNTNRNNEFDEVIDYLLEQYHCLPIPNGPKNALGEILKLCKKIQNFELVIPADYLARCLGVTYETSCSYLRQLRNGKFKNQKIDFPYIEVIEKFIPKRKSYKYKVRGFEIYRTLHLGEYRNKIRKSQDRVQVFEMPKKHKKELKSTGVNIYNYLLSQKGNCTIDEISKSLGICRQTVSVKLNLLESLNYVEKYTPSNNSEAKGRPSCFFRAKKIC